MAPKIANTGAKRQAGDLSSWLRTSSHGNTVQPKRQRSESSTVAESKSKAKKSRTTQESKRSETASKSTPSKSPPSPQKEPTPSSNTLTLNETTGDLFSCAPNTLLIHACNCQGSWSGGIALAFKKHYPSAFKVYAQHCQDNDAESLLGTALLIPPPALTGDGNGGGRVGAPKINGKVPQQSSSSTRARKQENHFIGCLFTSNFYGKRKDSPSKILSATGPAMEDLLQQVREWNQNRDEDGEKVGAVRMCKINSGLFKVEWEDTKEVIEGIAVRKGDVREIEVVERE